MVYYTIKTLENVSLMVVKKKKKNIWGDDI